MRNLVEEQSDPHNLIQSQYTSQSTIAYSTIASGSLTNVQLPGSQVLESFNSESSYHQNDTQMIPTHNQQNTLPKLSMSASSDFVALPSTQGVQPTGPVNQAVATAAEVFYSDIKPMLPKSIPRYDRNIKIDATTDDEKILIQPRETEFLRDGFLPSEWKEIVHPEGQVYFHHTAKGIVTENWIWSPEEMKTVNGFIAEIDKRANQVSDFERQDAKLVIECRTGPTPSCMYYYACAVTSTVRWFDSHDLSKPLRDIFGGNFNLERPHIKLYLNQQYWHHWELFPQVNDITPEIRDVVLNMIIDARTGDYSLSFAAQEVQKTPLRCSL